MAEDTHTTVVKDQGSGRGLLLVALLAIVAVVAVLALFAVNRHGPGEQLADVATSTISATGDAVEGAAAPAAR